jgi:NADPH-dependent glutamate synthase beta subunit-like oxidoreductase/Pyruvate/2-oxoacid:ferredoxin oxidoreductase delta subunit
MSGGTVKYEKKSLEPLPALKEKVSPCRIQCPLENGISQWMGKVKNADWEGAWNIIKCYNPFPAITGYTCYQFCRDKCNREQWDEAIAIGEIEKAIGFWRHDNYRTGSIRIKPQQKKVAIVGSGPAGLSCAYYLNQMGAEVTVLEKLPLAGGLLATGIPEYRLPRNILKKEVEILQSEGIIFKTGFDAAKDENNAYLQENFDAIVLAAGAQSSRALTIKGADLKGITGAIDFLREVHLKKAQEIDGRAVVVGGGNAAMDAACVAKLQGAEEVTLLYRRSESEMPAHPDEIEAAKKAGVKFIFNAIIEDFMGDKKVESVRTMRTAFSHRGDAIKIIPGTDEILECNLVVIAAGQESSLAEFTQFLPGQNQEVGSLLGDGAYLKTSKNIVLAAGDSVTGTGTVAGAIFSGRKASLTLSSLLLPPEEMKDINKIIASPLTATQKENVIDFDSLNPHFYVKQGSCLPSPEKEAARCFSCGFCNNCGVCWALCPDFAIKKENGHFEFVYDYCKSCKICVSECPSGSLEMLYELP